MTTLRILLSVLLLLHAAVHLIGAAKWMKLLGRTFALLFFGTFAMLATAAVLLVLGNASWWTVALPGVLLSQALIIAQWSEAKWGTIANVVVAVPLIVSAAQARFIERVGAEVSDMMVQEQRVASGDSRSNVVQASELDRLPPPVRRWLEGSGVVGHERARIVWLEQRGELRTGRDEPWMKVTADQTFTVDDPAFVWTVETKMGFVPITGRDRYTFGRGEMLVKAAGLVNVANGRDEKTTQGAMLRYLGETVWFPSAALSPYIVWEPIDESNARATMHHANRTVSASFTFDGAGRVNTVRAMRWYGSGDEAKLLPWYVPCTDWRDVRGVIVPVRGSVIWELPEGDFEYYRWEIVDIETNRRERSEPPAIAPVAFAEPSP